jgi:hypothetical protein
VPTFHASTVRWITLCILSLASVGAFSDANAVPPPKQGPCANASRSATYVLLKNGIVQKTGRAIEGPACVQVIYNPFRFDVNFTVAQALTAGPNPGDILKGAASTPAAGQLKEKITAIQSSLDALQAATDQTTKTIADLRNFLGYVDDSLNNATQDGGTVALANAEARYETVLRTEFKQEQVFLNTVHATDVVGGSCPGTLAHPLADSIEFQLAALQDKAQVPLTKKTADLTNKVAGVSQDDVDAATADLRSIQGLIAEADLYKCGGPALQSLAANIVIIEWWKSRLNHLGFAYEGTQPKISANVFYLSDTEPCSLLFNQNLSDTYNVNGTDQQPTLDKVSTSAGTVITSQAFVTLKCSSPISLSAGVEFSGIRNQEYAIIKSAPPAGGTTSVAKFAYTTNSPIHLLPIAMTNVRLAESQSGRYAGHFSVGVAGNFQGTYSGGSTAEFLIGPSLSLFRCVFLTAGAHIGFQSQLVGGFNVGDTAPSDVSTPTVTKSAQVRYGFAITFTKP